MCCLGFRLGPTDARRSRDVHRGQDKEDVGLHHAGEQTERRHDNRDLESSTPRNVPFYRRFGFESIGEIKTETSPVLTPMVRPGRG
jgi:hypothetical protein